MQTIGAPVSHVLRHLLINSLGPRELLFPSLNCPIDDCRRATLVGCAIGRDDLGREWPVIFLVLYLNVVEVSILHRNQLLTRLLVAYFVGIL